MKRKTSNLAALVVLGGFLLGIHGGKVTLWRDGSDHPEQVFDIRADSLPPAAFVHAQIININLRAFGHNRVIFVFFHLAKAISYNLFIVYSNKNRRF